VIAFQRDRGLNPDGLVGPETWRMLYEAGFRLGDRLLYMRRPMLRGEDVSELQSRLNNLGFDAGKIDGVFGRETARSVEDFQHNRGLPEDGRAGPEVITELLLVTRGAIRAGREAIREREWMRMLPANVVGTRVYFDPACRTPEEAAAAWAAAGGAALEFQERGGLPLMSRSADTALPERVRAGRANRLGADVIVSFQLCDEAEGVTYYFATERSRSEAGARLAERLAEVLAGRVEGRATAILKETRAPAVVVAHPALDEKLGRRVVDGLEAFFRTAGG
jgi:N-acetylmuramoyl-L-alanine amidase